MNDIETKLLELNQERINILNTKEYFLGRKLIGYLKSLCSFDLAAFSQSFFYDLKSLKKIRKSGQIIDFEIGKKIINKKLIIYTSIFGDYDQIYEPMIVDDKCEYIIFTDKNIPSNSSWVKGDNSKIPIECNTNILKNRYVKMFPHKLFDNQYSVYIDGNLQIVGRLSRLLQEKLDESLTGIAMHLHPRNDCIFDEAKSVLHMKKITYSEYKRIIKFYLQEHMPKHYGMFECNVILRDHRNKICHQIMEDWWMRYYKGIKRDQLYFTYILYKNGLRFEDVISFGASVNHNNLFFRREHR